jgi:hypothetical protein
MRRRFRMTRKPMASSRVEAPITAIERGPNNVASNSRGAVDSFKETLTGNPDGGLMEPVAFNRAV